MLKMTPEGGDRSNSAVGEQLVKDLALKVRIHCNIASGVGRRDVYNRLPHCPAFTFYPTLGRAAIRPEFRHLASGKLPRSTGRNVYVGIVIDLPVHSVDDAIQLPFCS